MSGDEDAAGATLTPASFDDVQDRPGRAAIADVGPYEDLGLLGKGGMATVRRVRDPQLNRVIAMKILRPELAELPRALALFRAEAQTSAQLAHPGIVPVHEIGALRDGNAYFTMKEIEGRTLTEVIRELHGSHATEWTLRRLVAAFRQVCDAMAYAHDRGVIHRDLKPDNIMLGAYGEVLVVDWGVAKVVDGAEDTVTTVRATSAQTTQAGTVTGTPAYMPPEQARGQIDRIGPHSDVYALGGILYEILVGRSPRRGGVREVLDAIRAEVPLASLPEVAPSGVAIPAELRRIADRALHTEIGRRYANAGELVRAVEAWLDGSRRKQEALDQVEEARAIRPRIRELRARSAALQRQAADLLEGLPPYASESDKAPGWALEDAARGLQRDAEVAEVELTRRLQAALAKEEVVEAHELLAEHYRELHEAAEAARDEAAAARYARLLEAHDVGTHTDYLSGEGRLTLHSDPPAHAELFRYVVHHRRLVLEPVRSLGLTPHAELRLPMGSYLVELGAPGFETARYPVHIGRMDHWDARPPGASASEAVRLLPAGSVGPGECYVPAGPFVCGGDELASNAGPRAEVWLDGFVIDRFAVTCAQYIAFLDDLVDQGREEEALAHAPRERAGKHEESQGALLLGRDERGHFHLVEDADGDMWDPQWPIIQVDWYGASAYAAWRAERDELPWRLPSELEWEKAARGVDGRLFPWGDFGDGCWASCREHAPQVLPRVVDSHPIDCSPYGVRGLGGNCKCWCLDGYAQSGPTIVEGRGAVNTSEASNLRVFRGGSWNGALVHGRSARRDSANPRTRYSYVGVRLARSV